MIPITVNAIGAMIQRKFYMCHGLYQWWHKISQETECAIVPS